MDEADSAERALIAAAGLEPTYATHPSEVLAALRAAAALRARLARPGSPTEEPSTVFQVVSP